MDKDIPFYLQVKNYIKSKILIGELVPGNPILSERELTEKFGLSRSTVRRALSELVFEGYLIKVQGKGTFVSKHNIEGELTKIAGIHSRESDKSFCSGYKNISESLITVDEDIAKILNCNSDTKIYQLERTVLINNILIGIEKISSYPEYVNEINNKSINELEMIGGEALEEINIVSADKREANYFSINVNDPIFQVTVTIFKHCPIIYTQSLYNAENVKLIRSLAHKKKGGVHKEIDVQFRSIV